jgi:hypothetical protein
MVDGREIKTVPWCENQCSSDATRRSLFTTARPWTLSYARRIYFKNFNIKQIIILSPIYAKVLQVAALPSCLPIRICVCTILRITPIRLHHFWTDVYKVFTDPLWICMSSRRSFLHIFCFDGIWLTWYLTQFHSYFNLVRSNPVPSLLILFTFPVMEHPVIIIIRHKFSL